MSALFKEQPCWFSWTSKWAEIKLWFFRKVLWKFKPIMRHITEEQYRKGNPATPLTEKEFENLKDLRGVKEWEYFPGLNTEPALDLLMSLHELKITMTEARWKQLMETENEAEAVLTREELEEGWHWCPELDFLLVNWKTDGECCTDFCRGIERQK